MSSGISKMSIEEDTGDVTKNFKTKFEKMKFDRPISKEPPPSLSGGWNNKLEAARNSMKNKP